MTMKEKREKQTSCSERHGPEKGNSGSIVEENTLLCTLTLVYCHRRDSVVNRKKLLSVSLHDRIGFMRASTAFLTCTVSISQNVYGCADTIAANDRKERKGIR